MPKITYLDFEYNNTAAPFLNIVCAAIKVDRDPIEKIWLHKSPENRLKLKKQIIEMRKEGSIFVAYNAQAEARSLIALGVDPLKVRWLDLYLEYRMLTNHNHALMYGKQLIDGVVKYTEPPKNKYQQSEEERDASNHSKPKHNLAAACFKLLGVKIDTDEKTRMRDLIISSPDDFTDTEKTDIMNYCASDVENLPALLDKTLEHYNGLYHEPDLKLLPDEMRLRGEYAARSALIESMGYGVDVIAVKNFIDNVPHILKDLSEDINSQFDELKPFKWNKPRNAYSMDTKNVKAWVKSQNFNRWLTTDKGDTSLKLEAFTDHFNYSHDFPRGNYGAQILRYLKIKQSLNGFMPIGANDKKRTNFKDVIGVDGRVRPFMGIYGSQSSRSQPSANGFIPLKASWMRSLIAPDYGNVCFGIDYSSQEFLLSALVSKDENMIEAYRSGDVYLYFAKLAGAVPMDGKKEDYAKERNLFKATTLGISYNMGATSLAAKLTADMGHEVTVDDAAELIAKFREAYPRFADWNNENLHKYVENKYLKLPCGWTIWGDNNNYRSINNVPIQGFGASIMRKAVALAQDRGVKIIYTLHDALYGESSHAEFLEKLDVLKGAMIDAFCFYFDDEIKEAAKIIRLDAFAWSKLLEHNVEIKTPSGLKVWTQKTYIDERSENDYLRFQKYFSSISG